MMHAQMVPPIIRRRRSVVDLSERATVLSLPEPEADPDSLMV
jgi:hypothetical protein